MAEETTETRTGTKSEICIDDIKCHNPEHNAYESIEVESGQEKKSISNTSMVVKPSRFRITAVIAHIDHGKTTLIDSLIASSGFISKSLAGDMRYLDSRNDEQQRGITLKLTPVLIRNHYILDTPGHVDFESLIYSSAVLTDNFLILVDVNEGITPRTYSLVKFINRKRSILVLNKIDKSFDCAQIQSIVYQINNLVGEDVFAWEKNNVIVCCATFCAGTNYKQFTVGRKNSLSTAIKAFEILNKKIANNDTETIVKKYNIRIISKKHILSTVFPLCNAIFDSIENFYLQDEYLSESDKLIYSMKEKEMSLDHKPSKNCAGIRLNDDLTSIHEYSVGFKNSYSTPFYTVKYNLPPKFLAITVYALLNQPLKYQKNNLLFVTRVLYGTIGVNELVLNISNGGSKWVRIERIFDFSISKFIEINHAERGTIVCLVGDFEKNSIIVSEPCNFHINPFLSSFYKSKISLRADNQIHLQNDIIESFKEVFRTMSFTEPSLKVRKNRYGEFEIGCSGQVQFEKICSDLSDIGFDFEIKDSTKKFREFAASMASGEYNTENMELHIVIQKNLIDSTHEFEWDCTNKNLKKSQKYNNVFEIYSEDNREMVESVLEMFCESGPLIKEPIMDTHFTVRFSGSSDPKIFSMLKNQIEAIFLKTNPSICTLFYQTKISLQQEYLGSIYMVLQKYFYKMEKEVYDEESEFFIILCKIPQFLFKNLVEDIRVHSKGTAYLEVEESEYFSDQPMDIFIDAIKREKGVFLGDKIVENPEKQRTLKK